MSTHAPTDLPRPLLRRIAQDIINHLAMQQAALKARVVDACTKHKLAHWRDDNYRACVSLSPDYFVKYDHPSTLAPQLATQEYIYEYAKSSPDAPRIPQVIHHFGNDITMYVVMEFITFAASPPDIERTAKAVKWLWVFHLLPVL